MSTDPHLLSPIRALAALCVLSLVLASCSNGPDVEVPTYSRPQPIPRCSRPDVQRAASLATVTVHIPGRGPVAVPIPGRVLAISPYPQTIWVEPVGTACLILTVTSKPGASVRRLSSILIKKLDATSSLETLVADSDYVVQLGPAKR